MGFFNNLGRLLSGRPRQEGHQRQKLLEAWNVYDDTEPASEDPPPLESPADPAPQPAASTRAGLSYDQAQWRKKLKRILENLPDSASSWGELANDIVPLGIDPNWARECELEEFELMVRRAVADSNLTETEHENLEIARKLVGLSDEEASEILNRIVTEAEAFFGHDIQGAH